MKRLPLVAFLFICSLSRAQLVADFSASVVEGCTPLVVQFNDNSTGAITSWFWDFGNGVTSTAQNPVVTYTTGGKFTVRLIIRNDSLEDFEEKTEYITAYATPGAVFSILSGTRGCAPVKTTFKDKSNMHGDTAKSWLWDFADGSTSNEQDPVHTFATRGVFDVSLTVTSIHGCSSTYTRVSAVATGNPPVANFFAAPLSGCASLLRQFTDSSLGTITSYSWNFGDGGTSIEKNPLYHYQDTGLFAVKLTVSDNGCQNLKTKTNYIQASGSVAKFTEMINCPDKKIVNYTDSSINEIARLWDFGDGFTSTDAHVVHTYASPGVYYVKLMVTGATCNDTAYDTVRADIGNPQIQITPVKNLYCRSDLLSFFVTDYDTVYVNSFAWNFGDSITRFNTKYDTVSYRYSITGTFKPEVYLQDKDLCIDTIRIIAPIVIKGPTAAFDSLAIACTGADLHFAYKTTAFPNVPVTQVLWSFGDGITSDTIGSVDYSYAFPGRYKVYLKATDADGCVDSVIHYTTLSTSPVVNAGNDTLVCAGSNIVLNSIGATDYSWRNNPDLSCINCANPIASPSGDSVVYYVTGTSNGCAVTDSIKIKIQNKQLVTLPQDAYAICQGNTITLNASGADNYQWSPSTALSSDTINNPVASPVTTTVYTVTGKDSNNCFTDAASVTVTVNIKPVVNIPDSIVQQLIGSSYTITSTVSPDATSLDWSPKTGLSCYTCLQPVAIIDGTTTYTLTATNQFGCSSTDSITIVSVCKGQSFYMPNTFSPNNDGMNDYFYPRSGSAYTVSSLVIFNRWGQKLFEKTNFPSNNYSYGWNGKYLNQEQAADVYIYMMELQCADGKKIIKKGNITLLR